jgi:hypothetical protein
MVVALSSSAPCRHQSTRQRERERERERQRKRKRDIFLFLFSLICSIAVNELEVEKIVTQEWFLARCWANMIEEITRGREGI